MQVVNKFHVVLINGENQKCQENWNIYWSENRNIYCFWPLRHNLVIFITQALFLGLKWKCLHKFYDFEMAWWYLFCIEKKVLYTVYCHFIWVFRTIFFLKMLPKIQEEAWRWLNELSKAPKIQSFQAQNTPNVRIKKCRPILEVAGFDLAVQ